MCRNNYRNTKALFETDYSGWKRFDPGIGLLLSLSLLIKPMAVFAESATPGSILLEELVITGEADVLSERIKSLAGGADLVYTDDVDNSANLTMSRALAETPGVVIQNFFGGNDQPRIQIRGSGLQQNPVERGVLILQNGLPINRADGSYIVGIANPAQAEAIEIYRGYLANRLGATVLGGALNFMSPTGNSSPGGKLTLSGGSFGQFTTSGQYGWEADKYDALLQVDITGRDGFRDYNDSKRLHFAGNAGIKLTENTSFRIFVDHTKLKFDVSGPLTAQKLKSEPESIHIGPTVKGGVASNPGPNVIRDRPQRDTEQSLIGLRLTTQFESSILDMAFGYTNSNDTFRFPIPGGIRGNLSNDVTGVLRYGYKPNSESPLPLFEVTSQYVTGSADRDYFINTAGKQGARFGANELDASTLSVSAGFHFTPTDSITISPSISYSNASRDNDDVYTLTTRPTIAFNPANPTVRLRDGAVPTVNNSYKRDYKGWSPALGLSWQPNNSHRMFAAISRSFEPPTHEDLISTINGTPNSSPGRPRPPNPALVRDAFITPNLKAQEATTLEGGWKAQNGVFSWDITTYYSWIKNELLALRDENGSQLGAVNANDTRHLGIELGLAAQFTPKLNSRIVYTFQDFRFDNDPKRSNNRLAGAPRHWLFAAANYNLTNNWSAGASLRWMIEKTPVDNFSTLFNDAYTVLDLRSDYQINNEVSMFIEVTNVTDETYASSTLITDRARSDQAAFLAGDGRSFFLGIQLIF